MNRRDVLVALAAGLLVVSGAQVALTQTTTDARAATAHPTGACSAPYHVTGAGWDLCWQREDVRVQGLEINRALFEGEPVVWKMGVPFSLTEYGQIAFEHGPFKDVLGTPGEAFVPGFGRGSMQLDEAACPRFQPQGELVDDGRVCVEHRGGVAPEVSVWTRYDAFNYRFLQGYHFDDRGEVEPFLALGGQLLDGAEVGAEGANHYHHVYWRVDLDVAQPGNDTFQVFQRGEGQAPFVSASGSESLEPCQRVGEDPGDSVAATAWCDVPREAKLTYEQKTHDKWRVVDEAATNGQGHAKSFQFVARSAAPTNGFSSFDALVLEYAGDSSEIGYEVPSSPAAGDRALNDYLAPPEDVRDPVAWVVNHVFHETRDEERGSMTYHYVDFTLQPRNFVDRNPAEDTFP